MEQYPCRYNPSKQCMYVAYCVENNLNYGSAECLVCKSQSLEARIKERIRV